MSLKKLIDLDGLSRLKEKILALIPSVYAGSNSAGGPATVANGIHYAQVNSNSTSTVFTATIEGITSYYNGLTVLLKNGVVTSASGFTININNLGAKPVYNNMAAAGRETTIFNVNYTLLLVYDEDRVDGGCWICYRGYYSDANTVPTGYCTTAAGTAAKSATCNYGYRDDDNYFPCLFRYANTAANATLAIASYATTAAPIYVNGARTSANNTFSRGVILFLYHNNAYYCYNDGRFPILVDGVVTSVQEYVATKYTKPSSGIPKTDLASDVQTSLGKADTALQAHQSLKTVNGNSLVGSGNISIPVLPAVTSADNGKVLMVTDGAWAAGELPVYNGEIVTPAYNVTISLTNPVHPSFFHSCKIYKALSPYNYDNVDEIGEIESASGSTVVAISGFFGLNVFLDGTSVGYPDISCTGGVSYIGYSDFHGTYLFEVTGDGAITLDGIDYND